MFTKHILIKLIPINISPSAFYVFNVAPNPRNMDKKFLVFVHFDDDKGEKTKDRRIILNFGMFKGRIVDEDFISVGCETLTFMFLMSKKMDTRELIYSNSLSSEIINKKEFLSTPTHCRFQVVYNEFLVKFR